MSRFAVSVLAASVVAGGALVSAGQAPAPARPASAAQGPAQGQTAGSGLPLAPTIREHGTSITPAFEGWYHGKDGFDYALVGYFNRNTKEEFEVPVGPNNHVDPGGPDQGQPTHFLLGRQWGVFTVKMGPKASPQAKAARVTWTLVVNGQTNSIVLHTLPDYIVEPYGSSWNNNTPPVLKLAPNGPGLTGPPQGIAATLTTTMPNPVTLTAWITDDGVGARGAANSGPAAGAAAPAAAGAAAGRGAGRGGAPAGGGAPAAGAGRGSGVSVSWTKFRGPGTVTFANAKPAVDAANGGKTETTATFDTPGDYVLRVQGNDQTGDGGGGEQCCWTNAAVKVIVNGVARATTTGQ